MKIKYVISLGALIMFARASCCAVSIDGSSGDSINDLSAGRQLWMAVREGNVTMLVRALAQGVNINATDRDGRTPLIVAVINGFTLMAAILIERQADVHVADTDGLTALMLAVEADPYFDRRRADEIDLLIRAGADSSAAFKRAIDRGNKAAVVLLMEHGANMWDLSLQQEKQLEAWGMQVLGG